MSKTTVLIYVSTFLLLLLSFLVSISVIRGTPTTTIAVDPSFKEVIIGSNFTLDLNISDATDLYLWVVTIEWNHSIIEFQKYEEGPFLKVGGSTTIMDAGISAGRIERLVCTVLGSVPGVDGDGCLITFTFNAKALGTSPINITFSDLLDSNGEHIPPETYDGVVRVSPLGTPPVATFTWSPSTPKADESVEFDASASQSGSNGTHDMPITEYRWDFGDGNVTTTSTPIVYHCFSSSGNYYVTLTVYAPGASPETDSVTHKVTVVSVPVGGYSYPINIYTIVKPLAFSLVLVAILATVFTMIRRKTRRRTKEY